MKVCTLPVCIALSNSLEVVTGNQNSAHQYFASAPRPSIPSSANRSSSTSRGGNRSSLVDYDRVPSPRVAASSSRLRNGTTPQRRPLSRLSEVVPPPDSPEQQFDDFGDDFGGDDFGAPQEPESSSPDQRRRSFSQMDDEGDEEPEGRGVSSPNVSTKSRRIQQPPSDNGVEDEIDQGLNEINDGEISEEEPPPPPKANAKAAKKRPAEDKPKKVPAKRQRMQENRPMFGE